MEESREIMGNHDTTAPSKLVPKLRLGTCRPKLRFASAEAAEIIQIAEPDEAELRGAASPSGARERANKSIHCRVHRNSGEFRYQNFSASDEHLWKNRSGGYYRRMPYLSFAFVCVIWGSSFI